MENRHGEYRGASDPGRNGAPRAAWKGEPITIQTRRGIQAGIGGEGGGRAVGRRGERNGHAVKKVDNEVADAPKRSERAGKHFTRGVILRSLSRAIATHVASVLRARSSLFTILYLR